MLRVWRRVAAAAVPASRSQVNQPCCAGGAGQLSTRGGGVKWRCWRANAGAVLSCQRCRHRGFRSRLPGRVGARATPSPRAVDDINRHNPLSCALRLPDKAECRRRHPSSNGRDTIIAPPTTTTTTTATTAATSPHQAQTPSSRCLPPS